MDSEDGNLYTLMKKPAQLSDEGQDPEWVISQTFNRMKKDIEDRDRAFEEHLADIRRREQALRKNNARTIKKPVRTKASYTYFIYLWSIFFYLLVEAVSTGGRYNWILR